MRLEMSTKKEVKQDEFATAVSNYLVEHGFRDSGIRKLAEVAGTSDRMLMYYFESKDNLVARALTLMAENLAIGLDSMIEGEELGAEVLLEQLTAVGSSKEFEPIIRLWFEIVGKAVRNEEPFGESARNLAENWEGWIRSKLAAKEKSKAADLFAHLEGRLMLHVLKR